MTRYIRSESADRLTMTDRAEFSEAIAAAAASAPAKKHSAPAFPSRFNNRSVGTLLSAAGDEEDVINGNIDARWEFEQPDQLISFPFTQ